MTEANDIEKPKPAACSGRVDPLVGRDLPSSFPDSMVTVAINGVPVLERFCRGDFREGLMPELSQRVRVREAMEDALDTLNAEISRLGLCQP